MATKAIEQRIPGLYEDMAQAFLVSKRIEEVEDQTFLGSDFVFSIYREVGELRSNPAFLSEGCRTACREASFLGRTLEASFRGRARDTVSAHNSVVRDKMLQLKYHKQMFENIAQRLEGEWHRLRSFLVYDNKGVEIYKSKVQAKATLAEDGKYDEDPLMHEFRMWRPKYYLPDGIPMKEVEAPMKELRVSSADEGVDEPEMHDAPAGWL